MNATDKTETLTQLEGEDVCVCIGTRPRSSDGDDDDLWFVGRKIIGNRATVVVVLWDVTVSGSQDAANDFLDRLGKIPLNTKVRFCRMSVEEWNRLHKAHRDECYGLVFLTGDDRLPKPSGFSRTAASPFAEQDGLEDFADVPDIRASLRLVAEVWAGKAAGGMWPVVLLTGPSGAGKTFAARRIYESLRAHHMLNGEFRHLNCGEFGKEDMNATLFGVGGNRFTGVEESQGAIGEAADGVVFLDEIGTLPPDLQPRLLTLLDNGEYRRHGDTGNTQKASCRFVFGTNEDLLKARAEKRFRHDLFNRINGIRIKLPPLAERFQGPCKDDFTERILERMCHAHGDLRFTRRAKEDFAEVARSHPWHGNFRDLDRLFNTLRMEAMRSWQDNVVTAVVLGRVWEAFQRETEGDEEDLAAAIKGSTHPEENRVAATQGTAQEDVATSTQGAAQPMANAPEEWPLLAKVKAKRGKEVGANEKAMLKFAFRVAAESPNCAKAGRRFYEGKRIKNPSSSFARYLERYEFRWDDNAQGHIIHRKVDNE